MKKLILLLAFVGMSANAFDLCPVGKVTCNNGEIIKVHTEGDWMGRNCTPIGTQLEDARAACEESGEGVKSESVAGSAWSTAGLWRGAAIGREAATTAYAKYGPAAVEMIAEYGPAAIKMLAEYGPAAIKMLAEYGPAAIKMLAEYGPAAAKEMIAKHGPAAVEMLAAYGPAAVEMIANMVQPQRLT